MAIRALLRVYGSVQGVNYRWFVQNAAKALNVNGWVRNLPDGSVEILCESPDEGGYDEFLSAISPKDGPRRVERIQAVEFEKNAEPSHSSFKILD